MTTQNTNLLPYRDTNNQTVAYAPAPGATNLGSLNASLEYDSDFEPLIPSSLTVASEVLDEDSIMRFTATGRPMPVFQAQKLGDMSGNMLSIPQLLPRRYTDVSIIPAIVVNVIPSAKTIQEREAKKGRRGSFMSKLKGEVVIKEDGKGLTKVIYMPRRDYLKWFARDLEGKYIGSEEYRQWGEEELEETFGKYKPVPMKKGYRPPF
jgi:hypothetical protein